MLTLLGILRGLSGPMSPAAHRCRRQPSSRSRARPATLRSAGAIRRVSTSAALRCAICEMLLQRVVRSLVLQKFAPAGD